ncbi:MAG: DUF1592 domain-containing protein [Polyangiaceae bacterium]
MRRLLCLVLPFLLGDCVQGDDASLPLCRANEPCDAPLAPSGLRRLSAREYRGVVRDLLGIETAPNTDFDRGRLDNGPRDVWITAELAEDYERLAWQVASEAVTSHRSHLVGTCERDCFDAFAATFVPRAYRRAPRTDELARLRDVWNGAGPDERDRLEATCAAVLGSPSFLYREEVGEKNDHGTSSLTDDELASALSFFLVGTLPDAELLRAAKAHELTKPEALEAQARRLIATDASKRHFETFLDEWMATDGIELRTKDEGVYPRFDAAYRSELHRDVRAFYRGVLDRGGSARALLDTPIAFRPETPRRYPDARVGILEHPAFLASHGGYDSSGPIPRGVFALGSLFCAPPAPPPPGISRRPPEPTQTVTTRERFEAHVTQPICQGCHTAIDGLGFGFEGFDGVGNARTHESGRPVDASGSIFIPGRTSDAFHGTRELEQRATQRRDVAMCYSVHLARFAYGGGERSTDEARARALGGGGTPDTTLEELLLQVIRTRAFRERRIPNRGGDR